MFSKTESRGTLVLLLLVLMGALASSISIHHLKSTKLDHVPDSLALASWVAEVGHSFTEKKTGQFSPRLQASTSKYRIAPFKKELRTSVLDKKAATTEKTTTPPKKEIVQDLNTATASSLQRVRGIGPSYSQRIVKYRTLLGGFSHEDQLGEVYGLKDETIKALLEQFTIQSSVQKFRINTDSIQLLAKHPYISYDLAKVIINYRAANGDIRSLVDFKNIRAVDDSTYIKLKPYLE